MIDTEAILGEAIMWCAWLLGLYLMWHISRHFKPSVSFKGWGTVRREFGIGINDLPAGLSMQGTGVRVGIYKTDMAKIGMDDSYLYLDRPFSSSTDGLLRIPYNRIQLVSPPSTNGGLFNLPVAGIFKVRGVDVWLGSPFAERIIARLT